MERAEGAWSRGQAGNLVGVSSDWLASAAFNDAAPPLHVAGARESNRGLFALLRSAADHEQAAERFQHYMALMFGLDPPPEDRAAGAKRAAPRHYRSSYLRLLRGWAWDSNGPEGAVLKGWVESRFGLVPTYHKERIARFSSPAWARYVEDKMGSRFHNNAILGQLDLLYEFAQWSLAREDGPARPGAWPGDGRHWRLYRGVSDFAEHPVVERIDARRLVLRLNNICSFTTERDIATWFGDRILEVEVPACKILFFNGLLPKHGLQGEAEVLAIGGAYRVRACIW
jgi:NAD+--dinitrogen-reductase ADP-D-ribosyltransferase